MFEWTVYFFPNLSTKTSSPTNFAINLQTLLFAVAARSVLWVRIVWSDSVPVKTFLFYNQKQQYFHCKYNFNISFKNQQEYFCIYKENNTFGGGNKQKKKTKNLCAYVYDIDLKLNFLVVWKYSHT